MNDRDIISAFENISALADSGCVEKKGGLTTATQNSGEPLPEPIRVSAGFLVTGVSGNIPIQTLPPRLIYLVIAIRAASIWFDLIQHGS